MNLGLLKTFIRTWNHHFVMQMATLVVLAGTYSVVTMAILAQHNLKKMLGEWGNNVQVSAYLDPSLTKEKATSLKQTIEKVKGVASTKFVSKDKAAEIFAEQMSQHNPNFLEELKYGNPLPASYEVHLEPHLAKASSIEALSGLAKKVGKIVGVDEVSYGQGWVENYSSLVTSFANTGWLVVLILSEFF